jgi:hypothetical protein
MENINANESKKRSFTVMSANDLIGKLRSKHDFYYHFDKQRK